MRNMEKYAFIGQLKKLWFIDEIWLFGSRARGDNAERADIDLAIICPRATREDWLLVSDIIENADTLLHVDCVRFDTLKDSKFRDNILKFKKVLYVSKDMEDFYLSQMADKVDKPGSKTYGHKAAGKQHH